MIEIKRTNNSKDRTVLTGETTIVNSGSSYAVTTIPHNLGKQLFVGGLWSVDQVTWQGFGDYYIGIYKQVFGYSSRTDLEFMLYTNGTAETVYIKYYAFVSHIL